MHLQNIYFISLGCAKNLVDSEIMLGKLLSRQCKIVTTPEEAEIIIVNTCSFIETAKEESINTILDMANYKDQQCKILVVAGCMSQRYSKELEIELPEVDLFIGTGEYHKIDAHIDAYVDAIATDSETSSLASCDSTTRQISFVDVPSYIPGEDDPRINTSPFYTSWLKVSEGCDRHCTFCIIPQIRGKHRSREISSLVNEAQKLVASGVREINLIAQDLSSYGKDLSDQNNHLITLLSQLEKIDNLKWIRLLYYYPDHLSDDLIEVIASSKKICHYLDIPIQHLSNSVLKKMNRNITGDALIKNIEKLRSKLPHIVLRTSIIVGFPGESDDDFSQLMSGLSQIRFNHVGVFRYSDEENTPAYHLPNKISKKIIDQRYRKIYRLQQKISREINKNYQKRVLEVLIEGVHEETDLLLQGRFYGQAPEIDGKVIINEGSAKPGEFVRVEIQESHEYDLVGAILSDI